MNFCSSLRWCLTESFGFPTPLLPIHITVVVKHYKKQLQNRKLMSNWKPYTVEDILEKIDNEEFVLPVVQRNLVWKEEKIELLFDTLLKGDSFGGIMTIVSFP